MGDQLKGIIESAFFLLLLSKEFAATGNSGTDVMSASSKEVDKVLQ